jgi:uncharacterized MAPEG superfamily protein
MPSTMPTELTLLVWSVALCVAQMLVAVITAQAQVSLPPLIGNREDFPELKGIAGRAARAHTNMISNLVMFAALALVAVVASRTNGMTALGAHLFFWGRLAYAGIYLAGIPWLRTGAWAVSMVGLVMMFLQLL